MFELPQLSFSKDALPGFCSAETFDYHYGKHHAAYLDKLNKAISGTDYENMELEEIIKKSKQENNLGIFNNAAQHFNHSFFWNCLTPGGSKPDDEMKKMLEENFGSVEEFKNQFSEKAKTLFGSGWTWLVKDKNGKLEIMQISNAGTPITEGKTPIITLDVWEHAYYIDFRNDRGKFVEEFWKVVNWDHNT